MVGMAKIKEIYCKGSFNNTKWIAANHDASFTIQKGKCRLSRRVKIWFLEIVLIAFELKLQSNLNKKITDKDVIFINRK